MYEEYFGLNRRPFSPIPSAEDFVSVPHLQEALDSLIACLSQAKGVAVVSAASGMGKSTLSKKLASQLRHQFRPVFLNGAGIEDRRGLLQAMLFELSADYVGLSEQEARLKLFEICRKPEGHDSPSSAPRRLLVIVEEAHLLPEPAFEELRTLGDYAPEGERLIQIVICGPFELEEKLTDPGLGSFSQRIGCQVHLTPLCRTESAQFIADRLVASGASSLAAMIDGPALDLICLASDGNLRCLTQLTDHALLLTFAMNRPRVDEGIVRTALDDLKELPLRWNEIPPPAIPTPLMAVEETEELPDFWIGGESPSTPESELETDEFEIPEFLISETSHLPSGSLEVPKGAEQEEPSQSAEEWKWTPTEPKTETAPEFFVYEVGADADSIPEDSNPADSNSTGETPAAETSLETDSTTSFETVWSMHTGPKRFETEMQETLLVDRYTLLDRYFELPEERRAGFDFSILASLSPDAEFDFSAAEEESEIPEAVIYPELLEARSELEVLESIRKLRREVADQLKDSLNTPYPNRHHQFDVVEPESDSRVSIPFQEQTPEPPAQRHAELHTETVKAAPETEAQPEAATSPAPERRFAQLFSRLRSRKQRIESKQPGK